MEKKSALYERMLKSRWELGLVRGGMEAAFSDSRLTVDWIVNPFRDRWFADPFVLDVTEDYVYVLAEEYEFKTRKGRIAKLSVNRRTLRIDDFVIVLELPTHLSFPNILRKDGHVYVYPESCYSGKLDLYEYDPDQEKLVFVQTICDDAVWDSSMVELPGSSLLFAAKQDDYHLDVYAWDADKSRYVFSRSVISQDKSSRMAGQPFQHDGKLYIPTQYCERVYGGGVVIKEVVSDGGTLSFKTVNRLESPHPKRKAKMHTWNGYKGVVIIDVGGFDYPWFGDTMRRISLWRKKIRNRK